jgi:transposase
MNPISRLFETANFPLRIGSSGTPRNLMIRPGFLDAESRRDLTELAQDGSAAHRLARRANALVLLDDGMDYAAIAKVLLIDDDTIRTWYALYHEEGIEGLASFGTEGSACCLTGEQQDKLTCWITEALPRSTQAIGAWLEKECRIEYQGRSGLIALLHRLGMEHRKPQTMSHKRDTELQAAFIKAYDELRNQLDADEAVLFAEAVYPAHAVRPMGGSVSACATGPFLGASD